MSWHASIAAAENWPYAVSDFLSRIIVVERHYDTGGVILSIRGRQFDYGFYSMLAWLLRGPLARPYRAALVEQVAIHLIAWRGGMVKIRPY